MSLDDINNGEDFPNLLKIYPLEEAHKYRAFTRINVDYENDKIEKWVEIDFPRLLNDTIKINKINCEDIYILTLDEINSKLYDTLLSYYYNSIFDPKLIKKLLLIANNNELKKDIYYLNKILAKSILKYPNINPDDPTSHDYCMDKMYHIYIKDLSYCFSEFNLFDAIEGNINEYNKFEISKIPESDYQKIIQYSLYNELSDYINDNIKPFEEFKDYDVKEWLNLSKKLKNWSQIFENKYNEYKNINYL